MWNIDKPIPKEWDGRRSISAKEFIDWQNGKMPKKKVKLQEGPKIRLNIKQDYATYLNGVLTIVIHELPPSQNIWKKWHWTVTAEETRRWNEIIILLARQTKAKFMKPIIRFNFYFRDGRAKDRKNFESWKPLLDGLTMAGTIKDDNYKVIKEEISGMYVDNRNPRTEIIVREG